MSATTWPSTATASGSGGTRWKFSPSRQRPAIRVEFFGDEIDRISEINVVTGTPIPGGGPWPIYPASHYGLPKEKMAAAIQEIYREMEERVAFFKANDQLLEAQRISQRTLYDIEMMRELGYCSGIENYSRVIAGRPVGPLPHDPAGLLPQGFSSVHRRSHVTLPQVRAMYNRDRARKPPWWTTASGCPAPLTTVR